MHRSKTNKDGEHPIYCRLTVQRKIKEFATQIWVQNNKWNPSSSKISGTNEAAITANHTLNIIRNNLLNIRADLQAQGKLITSEIVVNIHLGKGEKKYTLILPGAGCWHQSRHQSLSLRSALTSSFGTI